MLSLTLRRVNMKSLHRCKALLTCIDCGVIVGTSGDKNVPVRCKECAAKKEKMHDS